MRLICPRCANAFEASGREGAVCPSCGHGPRAAAPVGATPVYTVEPAPRPAAVPPAAAHRRSGLAVTALVLGIVGVVLGWVTMGLIPLFAVVFGLSALSQIRASGARGKGMAVAGLVLGSFVLGTMLLVAFVAGDWFWFV